MADTAEGRLIAYRVAEIHLKAYAVNHWPDVWEEYKSKASGNIGKAWELWMTDMSEVWGNG